MPGAPVYLSARAMAQVDDEAESFEWPPRMRAPPFRGRARTAQGHGALAVSPALLRLLEATPRLGRLFTDEEARRGTDGVVLLSYGAWTRRFGANPDVVGTVIDVRGERRTVVGVIDEGFYFPAPGRRCGRPWCFTPTGQPSSCWDGSVRGSRRDRPPPRSAPSCSAWKAPPAGSRPGARVDALPAIRRTASG